jgi:hypothetical protein
VLSQLTSVVVWFRQWKHQTKAVSRHGVIKKELSTSCLRICAAIGLLSASACCCHNRGELLVMATNRLLWPCPVRCSSGSKGKTSCAQRLDQRWHSYLPSSYKMLYSLSFVEVSQLPKWNPLLFQLGCRGYKRLIHSLILLERDFRMRFPTITIQKPKVPGGCQRVSAS